MSVSVNYIFKPVETSQGHNNDREMNQLLDQCKALKVELVNLQFHFTRY